MHNLLIALVALMLFSALPAEAQQPGKIAKIGWLGTRPASGPDSGSEVIRRELLILGYIEGKNLTFEYRYTEGNLDRLPDPG